MPVPGDPTPGDDLTAEATLDALARLDPRLLRDLLQESAGLGDLPGHVVGRAASSLGDVGGLPALRVTASVDWSVEVSGQSHAYDEEGAARDRVRRLAGDLPDGGWLFVMTPDPPVPAWLAEPDLPEAVARRLVWVSLAWLAGAARDALGDPAGLLDPRSRVALADLLRHYDESGVLEAADLDDAVTEHSVPHLLTTGGITGPTTGPTTGATQAAAVTPGSNGSGPTVSGPTVVDRLSEELADTLVVRAEGAWTTYLDHAAYVTAAWEQRPGGVEHVAFVRGGRLMAVVPRIVGWHPLVDLTDEGVERLRAAGEPAAAALAEGLARAGTHGTGPVALVELTPAGHPATERLPGPLGAAAAGQEQLTRLELLQR